MARRLLRVGVVPPDPPDHANTHGVARRRWLAACWLIWLVASYALCVPRATLLDPLTSIEIETLGRRDEQRYTRLVLGLEVPPPFRYRALLPAVARSIPDPLIARLSSRATLSPGRMAAVKLVLLDALFLVLAAAALYRLLSHWKLGRELALLGTLLFLLSFPVVEAAGTPTLDIPGWFFLIASLAALLERRYVALGALFALGIFAKESVQVVVPLALVAAVPRRDRVRAAAALLPGLVAYYAVRLGDAAVAPAAALQAAAFGYFSPSDAGASATVASIARQHLDFAIGVLRPNRLVDLVLGSFGLLWIPAVRGWRAAGVPATLRRWAIFPALQLLLILWYGAGLGRVLFAAAPVVIAFALFGLRDWLGWHGTAPTSGCPGARPSPAERSY
ncbi:MAG TPA: hypothetical protein VFJ74_00155 [Gemmatimonadaceae bacterium]|nr:hypothetical protein [Gemmatimonadaceae bacterium]